MFFAFVLYFIHTFLCTLAPWVLWFIHSLRFRLYVTCIGHISLIYDSNQTFSPHIPGCINNHLLDSSPWMPNSHLILRMPNISRTKLLSVPLKPAPPAAPVHPNHLSHSSQNTWVITYSSFSLKPLIQSLRKSVGSLFSYTWSWPCPIISAKVTFLFWAPSSLLGTLCLPPNCALCHHFYPLPLKVNPTQ